MPEFAIFKRKIYKHLWFFRPALYLVVVTILVFLVILIAPRLKTSLTGLISGPKLVMSLINPAIDSLDSYQNRTNFLLLGVGGGEHPGADLTDSIMIISLDLTSGDTVLISLPRDIWVESLAAKLNTAYHYGQKQQPNGGGLILAKAAVSEIIDQPIHYGVVLDFSGFEKAIDVLGGVELIVPHGFIDDQYPIPGQENAQPESSRYERLEFKTGTQQFDGTTALKYVRSRYSTSEEGTDYARASRQQQVILSFKNKLLSPKILLNFKKTRTLYRLFKDSVETDLTVSSYGDVFKLSLKAKEQIRTGVIDQGSDREDIPGLLYHPTTDQYGQWVLLPVNNSWSLVHQYVSDLLYQGR
jgi:LCP family protein required for cell wall assembly